MKEINNVEVIAEKNTQNTACIRVCRGGYATTEI